MRSYSRDRATDLFCGIQRQRTEPNQSVANGKAERMYRTLADRSFIFNSTMPVPFWYACYVHESLKSERTNC
jgi:hypothetical protein